jgi:photosystem II stability/assembly factor-like uncharacterized protein
MPRGLLLIAWLAMLAGAAWLTCAAQSYDPRLFQEMRWRLVGPFRGGRVLAVAGVPSQADVFYFGAVAGGVWKSTDDGRIWQPIFDREPIASIGAIAIAPSNPNVIYVGTGEADMRSDISFGDGVYKSVDSGKTWTHIGLEDTQQIGRILVDPHNPDVVLVAALGHAYGPNADRGVFRSIDGGKTWRKVLYKDENTGAIDLAFDPDNPRLVYAALWQARRPAWSTYPPLEGPGSGLYRSTDGGVTWRELTRRGLPVGPLGRIGLAVGYGKQGHRVYALIDAKQGGLYRSDDAGQTWQLASGKRGLWTRGWYFGGVTVDPQNADIVYVANIVVYRSSDGGRHFTVIKGAPGGDDYHSVWINPRDSRRIILGSDQGTVVSVNGGATWSSWYNQPTAQFYHVSTDHRVPYWIYGAQQDSGTAAVPSRSDYGEITFRDWHPVGGGESGYLLPDPLDPDIIYGGSSYGGLYRYNQRTGQSQNISPYLRTHFGADISEARYRFTWTSPLAFLSRSGGVGAARRGGRNPDALRRDPVPNPPRQPVPKEQPVLLMGAQYLLETTDGGQSWRAISPDLTVRPGTETEKQRGVIYAIAPSALRPGEIWIGTDNGLVQVTEDGGKTWRNVTPPELAAWSKISLIEASHFDPGTAYLAVDRHRLDDYRPSIYRTHDFGKAWQKITAGIPASAYVHAVREDPVRRGLLYAGTETGVYVSFDDGDHWQSLQLNLPTAPVHDLAIEQGDLIAATHGRSFWVLDDLSPLRQLTPEVAHSAAHLFRPRPAWRIRRSTNTDTPLPPETPAGQNPPDGAIIDYFLGSAPAGPLTLEILDDKGRLIRRFSSAEPPAPVDAEQINLPDYWARPPQPLLASPGMHRFIWHLHGEPPQTSFHEFPISAIPHDTPLYPLGPAVLPGSYTVRLVVAGHSYSEPLEVRMDPRVKTSPEGLAQQYRLASRIAEAMDRDDQTVREVRALKKQTETLRRRARRGGPAQLALRRALAAFEENLGALLGETGGATAEILAGPHETSLARLEPAFFWLYEAVESADAPPTAAEQSAFTELTRTLEEGLAEWQKLKTVEVPALDRRLREADLPPLAP